MWFNKVPAKPTVAPMPTLELKPPPIMPGRHKGEYAKALNTIERFYGKGMKNHEVECIIAILNECNKDSGRQGAPEPSSTLPTPPPNSKRNTITVSVKADGLDELEKQLERIDGFLKDVSDGISKLQIK